MSVSHKPVGWNRTTILYDAALLAAVAAYIFACLWAGPLLQRTNLAADEQTLAMMAHGSCAFAMLTLVPCTGCRDRRFLPVLYSRRHFGVIAFAAAAALLLPEATSGVTGALVPAVGRS